MITSTISVMNQTGHTTKRGSSYNFTPETIFKIHPVQNENSNQMQKELHVK